MALAAMLATALIGFPFAVFSERSSSERSPPVDAELFRDAPLYPPLRDERYLNPSELQLSIETNKNELLELSNQNENYDPEIDNFSVTSEEANLFPLSLDDTDSPNDYALKPKFRNDENDSTKNSEEYNERDINTDNNLVDDVLNSDGIKSLFMGPEELNSDNRFIVAPGHNADDMSDYIDEKFVTPEVTIERLIAEEAKRAGTDDADSKEDERIKRSSGDWNKETKSSSTRRVKTGDTILNIRGAVRDAIGDAGAAPGPRASSRVDAFVIRPAPVMRDEPRDQARDARRDRIVNVQQPQKQERELLVAAHAHARINCDLVNVTNLRWYKDNEQINLPTTPGGGESAWREGDGVEIARASRGHAARWRCSGRDRSGRTVTGEPTRLLIYEPVRSVYLAVDGRRLDAGNTWVPVRDKTVLEVRCVAEGGVPPPELSWRLLALEPALDHRPYLRIHHTNYTIDGVWWSKVVVTAARELHNATLQCEARQRRPLLANRSSDRPTRNDSKNDNHEVLTAKLEIHVTYPPSFVISRWPGFGVSLAAGGAAALRCDVDANPPARATWLRDTDTPASVPTPLESGADDGPLGSATLRWPTLRETHAGWYRCRASWLDAEYSSIGYYLNVLSAEENTQPVTEADGNEEPDNQKVDVPLGGNVQLHCPKGSVGCWWRRVVGNSSDSWAPAGSHHAHGVLGIKEAVYEEGGEYRCVGARAPDLKRLRELKRVTLRVTGGATASAISAEPVAGSWRLECGACGRNLRVLWLRGGHSQPAILTPDLAQHCWKAVLLVPEPDEVWCVAVSSSGGAVAVFPRRVVPSPSPRHAVRALHGGAVSVLPVPLLISVLLVL